MVMNPAVLTSGNTEKPHRVVVKYCAGYNCRKTVTTHKVRQNINGQREYCSLICYHRWSPAMRETVIRFPRYEQSPSGLESLLRDLRATHGHLKAAEIVGFSRSTVSNWLRKLELFRRFAGQSPEAIVRMLQGVADDHGIDHAAKLIAVDPKTLQREFDRLAAEPEQLAS